MSRLPPAEKLPLALRKNIRDEWEANRADLETLLSEVLETTWTLNDINPYAIWPYADNGYAKDNLGSCIKSYVNAAIDNLKRFIEKHGEEGKTELNKLCHAHSLLIDLDDRPEPQRVTYCGVRIHEGKLVLVFAPGCLGVNIDYALDIDMLAKQLDEAAAAGDAESGAAMSYGARKAIKDDFDAKIGDVQAKVVKLLQREDEGIKLVPDFEDVYAKLKAAKATSDKGRDIRDDWESALGFLMLAHFEGLAYQLDTQGFGTDEMLREGLNEALEAGEFRFRIVDELKYGTYGEVVVEDGAVYLQVLPEYFGVNTDSTAERLLDQL